MARLKDQIGLDQADRAVEDITALRILDGNDTTLVEIEGLEWNVATVVGDGAVVGVSNAPKPPLRSWRPSRLTP